jgi:hypothetical protein
LRVYLLVVVIVIIIIAVLVVVYRFDSYRSYRRMQI